MKVLFAGAAEHYEHWKNGEFHSNAKLWKSNGATTSDWHLIKRHQIKCATARCGVVRLLDVANETGNTELPLWVVFDSDKMPSLQMTHLRMTKANPRTVLIYGGLFSLPFFSSFLLHLGLVLAWSGFESAVPTVLLHSSLCIL